MFTKLRLLSDVTYQLQLCHIHSFRFPLHEFLLIDGADLNLTRASD